MFVLLPERLLVLPSEPPGFNYGEWSGRLPVNPNMKNPQKKHCKDDTFTIKHLLLIKCCYVNAKTVRNTLQLLSPALYII
jgi:hypothetical protein